MGILILHPKNEKDHNATLEINLELVLPALFPKSHPVTSPPLPSIIYFLGIQYLVSSIADFLLPAQTVS